MRRNAKKSHGRKSVQVVTLKPADAASQIHLKEVQVYT